MGYFNEVRCSTDKYSKLQDCEPEGLSILTLQRIKSLEEIVELLEAEGDEQCQIDNILGILEAYRRKSLEWTGLVTYWSHGKQLCQPRPFDWDEFEAINEKYNGHKDFWVEGVSISPWRQAPFGRVVWEGALAHRCLE